MAKKKEEEAPKGSPAWMSTFSDLMNLLMCFFVLLFSMSSVDESKVEALIKSLADTFSIFDGGGSSFEDGVLISSGSTQLSYLDEYFNQSGQTDDGDSNQNVNNGSGSNGNQTGQPGDNQGSTGNPGDNQGNTGQPGDNQGNNSSGSNDSQLDKDKYNSGLIYEEIVGEANKNNIGDFIDVKVESTSYKYVEINISGSILFDSNSADFKDNAINVLDKVGDILKSYKGFKIEIIGHTDNVPLNANSKYVNNDILSAARAFSVGEFLAKQKYMGWDNIFCIGRGDHQPIKDNSTAEGRAANRRVEIRLYNNKAE